MHAANSPCNTEVEVMSGFRKATRKQAKLRLALQGPSGSGKTWGGLLIAKGIAEAMGTKKIAVIDTEKGSASMYSHLLDFDVLELSAPFSPERYVEAIREAEAAKYDLLFIDSTTHEWNGSGGCLEINDTLAQAKFRGNTWSAWNETTPRHRAFLDAIQQSAMHIIASVRTKTETAQTEENGKKRVVKLGMKAEQRDGIEYEFTTVLDIIHDGHFAIASKDRTGLFTGQNPQKITTDTGKRLWEWLNTGVVPEPTPAEKFLRRLDACNSLSEIDPIRADLNASKSLFSKYDSDTIREKLNATYARVSQAEAFGGNGSEQTEPANTETAA